MYGAGGTPKMLQQQQQPSSSPTTDFPNCRWIPMLAALLFHSHQIQLQIKVQHIALRNKLLMISAFVVVVAAAAADPNALFILRSCSKSKETTKKERKKERKNERKKVLSTYCWIPMLF
jgi:hypothetical protein